MSSRLATLYRERATLSAKLAEIDAEIAAAMAEGDEVTEVRRRRERPVGLPPVPKPTGEVEVSEMDRARAKTSLRRLGYRVRTST